MRAKHIILTQSQSAAGTMRQLLHKVRPDCKAHVIAPSDEYSFGPLSKVGTSREFILERAEFWRSCGSFGYDAIDEHDLRSDYNSMVKDIDQSKVVEIWHADSVQDFFHATVILHLLKLDGIETSGIFVRDLSGKKAKWGLGATNVEAFEALTKSSTLVAVDQSLYDDAWDVISKGTSVSIDAFMAEKELPAHMIKALSALRLRYPECNDGIGSIDRALLGAATEDIRNSARIIGTAMAIGMPENDHVGDLFLFKRLIDLSMVKKDPWFRTQGDTRSIRECSVQITDSGKEARLKFSVQIL